MFAFLGGVTLLTHIYNLNNIKSKTVGDGQHGTARWATRKEIRQTYKHIPFTPKRWREQAKNGLQPTVAGAVRHRKKKSKAVEEQALPQGIVVGCEGNTTALVDTGDVHVLMIGAAGVGKTAFWLYPCIEYACASGMSFLSVDTKGDVMRNYGILFLMRRSKKPSTT
jgi:type IV secretion system protein VirD4